MRAKEFLSARGVEYESINVRDDAAGREALARLGARTVPVVARGDRWVGGIRLGAVATLLGVAGVDGPRLSPGELVERLDAILAAAARLVRQIPAADLVSELPGRDRSYRALAHHVFRIPEAFLEAAAGEVLTAESLDAPPGEALRSSGDVARFGGEVREQVRDWWRALPDRTCQAEVRTYYGDQPLHELLERTTWHAAQHVRQLAMVLEGLGIAPDRPLEASDLEGLPMPEKVWDD